MKVTSVILCLLLVITRGCRSALPTEDDVVEAFSKARAMNLLKMNPNQKEAATAKCPLSLAHGKRTTSDPEADRKVNNEILATRLLLKGKKLSLEDLQQQSVRDMFSRINGDTCDVAPRPKGCGFGNLKYRNPDGSCNNKQNPEWGMAGRQQERVLPNAYADGLGLPRVNGRDGTPLPNPRDISNVINKSPVLGYARSQTLTLHSMGFGQFLDHDITLTPLQSVINDCCESTSRNDTDNCFNVIMNASPNEDSEIFTPGYCMPVKRSAPVLCRDSTSRTPVRQPKNSVTSFIDASNVYGSSQATQTALRDPNSGKLKTEGGVRPPNGNDDDCILTEPNQHCSAAGDVRVNEVPSLTSYHYLFILEHNRIAERLKDFYPGDNEKIFQETRRIVIATMQHIVYDEFLPSFMSTEGLSANQILSESYSYDAKINPTVFNAFGIAYRVGHTWVSDTMVGPDSRLTETTFNNPDMTYLDNAFSQLISWIQTTSSPETDRFLEEAVRSKLFIDTAKNTAFDLAALNIQRGRDHGLPPYNEYRVWCGLGPVDKSWQNFSQGKSGLVDHSNEVIEKLQQAGYKSPMDIDLWIGGITENPLSGGSIGPTFECIIGRMFYRLKFGDRFWYQNKDAGFTQAQQDAIKKYTFAKLLCKNYGLVSVNHPNAFRSTDLLKACTDITDDFDLNAFNPAAPPKPKG